MMLFPYTNFHDLNIDWLLNKVKQLFNMCVFSVNGVKPVNGDVSLPNISGVNSVNGKTGTVVLTANDVGALPDNYTPPVTSVNSKTGAVSLTASDVGALPDDALDVEDVTTTSPYTAISNDITVTSWNVRRSGKLVTIQFNFHVVNAIPNATVMVEFPLNNPVASIVAYAYNGVAGVMGTLDIFNLWDANQTVRIAASGSFPASNWWQFNIMYLAND